VAVIARGSDRPGGAPRPALAVIATMVVTAIALAALWTLPAAADSESSVTARVTIASLQLTVIADPDEVEVGDRFRVEATVTNNSGARVQRIEASILYDLDGLLLQGQESRQRGGLQPGQERTIRWQFQALESGTYIIHVQVAATFRDSGAVVQLEDTVIVFVSGGNSTTTSESSGSASPSETQDSGRPDARAKPPDNESMPPGRAGPSMPDRGRGNPSLR
jgi:hypothetical protein